MSALKAQGVAFASVKATEGSSRQNPKKRKNAEDAGLLSGADRFFSQPGRGAGGELHRRLRESRKGISAPIWAGGAFFVDRRDHSPCCRSVLSSASAHSVLIRRTVKAVRISDF